METFPRYWPFVRGIHRSPVNSPHKGQWRGALMFSLICVWINNWVNNHEADNLRRYLSHYDVTVMCEDVITNPCHELTIHWTKSTTIERVIRSSDPESVWLHGNLVSGTCLKKIITLQWRHNERDGVSSHRPYDCLLNRLFRRRSKKTSKLRVTGLCEGNSPGTGHRWTRWRFKSTALRLFIQPFIQA